MAGKDVSKEATWAEKWAAMMPRPEWENPSHWLGARDLMQKEAEKREQI